MPADHHPDPVYTGGTSGIKEAIVYKKLNLND